MVTMSLRVVVQLQVFLNVFNEVLTIGQPDILIAVEGVMKLQAIRLPITRQDLFVYYIEHETLLARAGISLHWLEDSVFGNPQLAI